jgi:hypothetical protein
MRPSPGADYEFRRSVPCPICGYVLDESTFLGPERAERAAPVDGDVSVCLACASASFYTAGASSLRPPTADERAELARDPFFQRAIEALIDARERSASWPKGPS